MSIQEEKKPSLFDLRVKERRHQEERKQGENSSASSSSKRKKMMKKKKQNSTGGGEGEEDRISSLPDAILHHILSYLDMNHVVQTSILSKRWTDLWASLGSLKFNSELFHSPETDGFDGFMDFVDQVLLLRDKYSDIPMFHLMNVDGKCDIKSSRLNTWIISVIRSKVQHLYIDIWGDGIRLPNRLFTCNSLTILMLALGGFERWSITLPPDEFSMCLPNLLILQLNSVSFHDENLTNKFFLSCPKLEELFLDDVEFLHMNVNISALKLVYLKVDDHSQDYGYCHWPNTKFKLHAPNLKRFICNDYMSKDYILGNLPSLVKADIDMKEKEEDQNPGLIYSKLPVEKKQMYAQRMMHCLRALLSINDLKLSAWFLEVISGSLDLLKGEPTELCDLTCLRLETWLSGDTIRAIAYLLKISPSIESLFLEISQIKSVSENIGDSETEVSLQCWLDKLEIVEIQGAIGCANELNFLEVLLKNAKVLKKLVIYTNKEGSPDRENRLMKFTKKLLLLPRASSNITILFF